MSVIYCKSVVRLNMFYINFIAWHYITVYILYMHSPTMSAFILFRPTCEVPNNLYYLDVSHFNKESKCSLLTYDSILPGSLLDHCCTILRQFHDLFH